MNELFIRLVGKIGNYNYELNNRINNRIKEEEIVY